jgi:hypothetical protein
MTKDIFLIFIGYRIHKFCIIWIRSENLYPLGGELRQLHLLEGPVFSAITAEPTAAVVPVEKTWHTEGKVFVNDDFFSTDVSQTAWGFYIGGYQPAQKWLKDRKDRGLNGGDIAHYRKIFIVLTETDKIMKNIDKERII